MIPSLIVYLTSVAVAFLAAGAVHVGSGRALYGLLTDSYQVRQFSIYLLDAIPVYLVGIYLSALVITTLSHRRFHSTGVISFWLWICTGVIATLVTVLSHSVLFPASAQAVIFLLIMSLFFTAAFPIASWVLFGWWPTVRSKIFPRVSAVRAGFVMGAVFALIYVLVLRTAVGHGVIVEEEIYRSGLEPTRTDLQFKPDSSRRAKPGTVYGHTSPAPHLFKREKFILENRQGGLKSTEFKSGNGSERKFGGGSLRFIDVDKNGYTDIAVRGNSGRIELWLNEGGTFKKHPGFLNNPGNANIHDFYFADFDNDGLQDILASRFVLPRVSFFENSFLKKIYWYPTEKPASQGVLFRQRSLTDWEDVTAKYFGDQSPWAYRKVEPVLWFDANSDGLLDIVWPQYPHPRRSLNWLYIQGADGSFQDSFKDMIKGSSARVFAEGSDVADLDGDGDIDLFAYGYLHRNESGGFRQICGREMPGMYCDASARNDEGGTFEDIDGDGNLDLVMSYHGTGPEIPKYYLQLYRGGNGTPYSLTRSDQFGRNYYGLHSYLRAKDFDFNGIPDLMTNTPGRILTLHEDQWLDLLPSIDSVKEQAITPLGWIDVEEDGDWDFIGLDEQSREFILFRNQMDPVRYVKISLLGARGVQNQSGATLRIRLPNGRKLIHVHRPVGGYAGVVDPRLIFIPEPGKEYELDTCFASLLTRPNQPVLPEGVQLSIAKGRADNCLIYKLRVDEGISRVDLSLIAGPSGATAKITRNPGN